MQLKILETMQKYNLELSYMQLLQLEVMLECKIEMLYRNELDPSREEVLLKKIYEISPSSVEQRKIHFEK